MSLAVLLGSAFIYQGQPSELDVFLKNPWNNGLKRILAFGLPGGLILFGIRYMIFQLLVVEDEQPGRKTLLYSSLFVIIFMALLGTIIFLNGGSEIALRSQ